LIDQAATSGAAAFAGSSCFLRALSSIFTCNLKNNAPNIAPTRGNTI